MPVFLPYPCLFSRAGTGSAGSPIPPPGSSACRDGHSPCRAGCTAACHSLPRRRPIPAATSRPGSSFPQLRGLLLRGRPGLLLRALLLCRRQPFPDSKEIIDYLKSEASEKYKENVIKMGIPEKFCIGVSTSTLRKFAKKLDKSNELAFELWNTHYHEARLLAVLIFDYKCLSYDQIDTLMSEVLSWDLCDHLCKNLIIKLDYYEDFIFNWIAADHIYKKRASFVLIAASTIHDKSMTKETLDIYLKLVYENSCYEHDHIKKAVSWALREIGKTDFEYAEKVLLTAYDLLASGNKVQIWIAKDVIKELETVVKVKERKRLITSNSKMGRER